ncbi:MAG: DUF1778 domain-containing protein [Alphaproteobacteria bacterium]|jgi:uncharacterized protein (DUF1778 family)|nr:DUF1778 domain-containing protein [Roseomonas sp.]
MSAKAKGRSSTSHRATRSKKDTASVVIKFRVLPSDRALIDEAALLAGKSRSEFVRAASLDAATDVIFDCRLLRLTPEAFSRFVEALDAPPNANETLRKLLNKAPPWQ